MGIAKKPLHPNLANPGGLYKGNNEYCGGVISLGTIHLSFEWDEKQGSWVVSCPNLLSDQDVVTSLQSLWENLGDNKYSVFNDESVMTFAEFKKLSRGRDIAFYNDEGKSFVIARYNTTKHSDHVLAKTLCLELSATYDITSNAREFYDHDLVYTYDLED